MTALRKLPTDSFRELEECKFPERHVMEKIRSYLNSGLSWLKTFGMKAYLWIIAALIATWTFIYYAVVCVYVAIVFVYVAIILCYVGVIMLYALLIIMFAIVPYAAQEFWKDFIKRKAEERRRITTWLLSCLTLLLALSVLTYYEYFPLRYFDVIEGILLGGTVTYLWLTRVKPARKINRYYRYGRQKTS